MHTTEPLDRYVIDVLPIHIAVLAQDGTIIAVNQAWIEFAGANGGTVVDTGVGVNYLEVCRQVQGEDAPSAQVALNGIQAVLDRTQADFSLEYPCHSSDTKRWFLMQVTPYAVSTGAVVLHLDITNRKVAEEALAEERNLLRIVIDNLPDHIFVKDVAGRYVLVNQAYARFLGVAAPEAMAGKSVFDIYPRELAENYHAKDVAVLQGGQTLANYEDKTTDQTGAIHYYLGTKTPLHNETGAITGLVGIRQDITERKQMEQELRASETFIRQVLDASPHLIFVKDWEGNFLFVNQTMADSLGRTKEVLIHQNSAAFYDRPDEVVRDMAVDRQVIETRQMVRTEEPSTTPDGQILWYHTIKTPLPQADGTVNMLGIATDITEQRRMMEAILQSEARNRALLEAIPDAIARIDRDGIYLDIKAPNNFEAIVPIAELSGQKQDAGLPPAIVAQFIDFANRAHTTGALQIFEYEILIDQEVRVREARIVPVGQGEVIAILRDISERKQAEAEKERLLNEVVLQREQLRALSRRLAEIQEAERKSIARELHDQVGQSLTALGLSLKLIQIQIPAELALEHQLKAQLQGSLALVAQTTGVIRNLMTELRPAVLDDYGLLVALRWYSAQIASYSALTIDVYGIADQPRLSETVENALFRIAQEAVTNIVKHAKTTQAKIHLATTDDQVTLEITDNGQGFNVENLMATTDQPHWGLLNMRERAEAIGGHFQIVSHPDAGVSVIVEVMR